jgi:hypothetical protein
MLQLIPQIFYDIIARLFSGSAAIILWCFIIPGSSTFVKKVHSLPWATDTNALFVFILISYLVGFISSALWDATLGKITKKKYANIEKEAKTQCVSEYLRIKIKWPTTCPPITISDLPSPPTMRDHLRDFSPAEASRLLKVRAERRLCQVILMNSFLYIVAILLLGWHLHNWVSLRWIPIILVVSYAAWFASKRLHKYYVNGIATSWIYYRFLK